MVNLASPFFSQKRKKSADMAESPPKRVTRARTKANEVSESGTRTTKITTASAKAAALSKTPIKPPKTTKRRTRADDATKEDAVQFQEIPSKVEVESSKTRGRPKRAAETEANQLVAPVDTLPRTRSRLDKPMNDGEDIVKPVPKPKGRSRKAVESIVQEVETISVEVIKPGPVVKVTRGRAATASTKLSNASMSKPAANRKTVAFKDNTQQDQENRPMPTKATEKSEPKPTGFKAKPIRKPVMANKGNTRGEKLPETKSTHVEENANTKPILPLSPKKVKQVAKSSSIGSEDELCGQQTPIMTLNKSPVKAPLSVKARDHKCVSKLDIDSAADASSPEKEPSSLILASPARRPPSSPFKDALKDSPKKFNIGSSVAQTLFSVSQPALKASLLQSPARRPASPTRVAAPAPLSKPFMAVPVMDAVTASKQTNTFKLPVFTPQKFTRNPVRAASSVGRPVKLQVSAMAEREAQTERPLKVQRMTVAKGDAQTNGSEFLNRSDGLSEQSNISPGGLVQETPSKATTTPGAPTAPAGMLQSPPTSPIDTENAQEVDSTQTSKEPAEEHSVGPESEGFMSNPKTVGLFNTQAFTLASPALRYTPEDSDSEDELHSPSKSPTTSPLQNFNISTKDFGACGTPTPGQSSRVTRSRRGGNSTDDTAASYKKTVSMTPLATQLSSWLASSPEKQSSRKFRRQSQGISSPAGSTLFSGPDRVSSPLPSGSPLKSTFFEDEMAVLDQQNTVSPDTQPDKEEEDYMNLDAMHDSQESEQYGDENAIPIDPQLRSMQDSPHVLPRTCTPARVFQSNPREIHTVSKVPLRAAADDSPVKTSRKRSRSFSGALAVVSEPQLIAHLRSDTIVPEPGAVTPTRVLMETRLSPTESGGVRRVFGNDPSTPKPDTWSSLGTPMRTVRKGADAHILRGAVVYVDVHTTEGADASAIFIELLTQIGARCVKQWTWNPRASVIGPFEGDQTPSSDESIPSGKVGITHVVFKDGGKRTLEKVRESKGLVSCVGVSWVLEYVSLKYTNQPLILT